jgi:hypothetical protein
VDAEAEVGVPGGIRTHDPPLRRRPLYPLSYGDTELLDALSSVTDP